MCISADIMVTVVHYSCIVDFCCCSAILFFLILLLFSSSQMTSSAIKFKCKSWIDTFGQRSAKAGGSLITASFASSIVDLTLYGSIFGVAIAGFMIWVSNYMGE